MHSAPLTHSRNTFYTPGSKTGLGNDVWKEIMVFPLSNVDETFHLVDEEGPLPSLLPDIERLVSVAAREGSMKEKPGEGVLLHSHGGQQLSGNSHSV